MFTFRWSRAPSDSIQCKQSSCTPNDRVTACIQSTQGCSHQSNLVQLKFQNAQDTKYNTYITTKIWLVVFAVLSSSRMIRDQPNSRKKMHDFTAEFLKCVKFHGKFTERVSEIHGPHRRYFEVLRYCKRRNFRTTNIYYTISQDSRQSMSAT